ncbi:MAG: phage tail tube protein [Desulfovibrionaceae bacterium]
MPDDPIKAQGVVLKRGDGASPEVFTDIAKIVGFTGPNGTATVRDNTTLADQGKVKAMGLVDEGQMTLECLLVPGDIGQAGLRADRLNGTLRNFKLVLTDAAQTTLTFSALVLSHPISGNSGDTVHMSVTLEISGIVDWS